MGTKDVVMGFATRSFLLCCGIIIVILSSASCSSENNQHHLSKPITDNSQALKHINNSLHLGSEAKLKDAIKEIEMALALDPDNPEMIFMIGDYYKGQNQLTEALSHYEQAIALDPENTEFKRVIAAEYQHSSAICVAQNARETCKTELNGALHHLTKLIELTPDDADAYHNRWWVTVTLPPFDEQNEIAAIDKDKACHWDNRYCR